MVILKLIGLIIMVRFVLSFCEELDKIVDSENHPVNDYGDQQITN